MDKDQVLSSLKALAVDHRLSPVEVAAVLKIRKQVETDYAEIKSLRIERHALAEHNIELMSQVRRIERLADELQPMLPGAANKIRKALGDT